jgi:hypothetical protein
MNSNRRKNCLGRHALACVGMLALGLVLSVGCDQPTPQPSRPQPPVVNAPPAPPPVVQKKAAVGVGAKGRGYGQGVIATPAASLFAAKEKLVFEAQIPQAMQLFKATEDRAPKDNDEFMEKIIKANNIKLPELPEGDRYMYDPKTEELMVESPQPE